MVRIIVEYDKENGTFKLLDPQFGSFLEDGAPYELLLPFNFVEGTDAEDEASLVKGALLAHA